MIQAQAALGQIQQGRFPWVATYLLFGEEPLYQREVKDGLWQFLQQQGVLERERFEVDAQFDWQGLQMETQAGSLFAHQRLIELEMPKGTPGKAGTQFIQQWCQQMANQPQPEITLLIRCDKLDSRQLKSKWVQAIEAAGLVIQSKPIDARQLPSWCQQRAEGYGLQLSYDAALVLAERVEGNLLAADQALQKLQLQYGTGVVLSDQQVADSVADQAHYQLFALSDVMLQGDAIRAVQILQRLQQEGIEAPVVLWLLAKEIRLLYQLAQKQAQQGSAGVAALFKQHRIWQSKQQGYRQALQRHSKEDWERLFNLALAADLQIKGQVQMQDPWLTLRKMVLAVSQSTEENPC